MLVVSQNREEGMTQKLILVNLELGYVFNDREKACETSKTQCFDGTATAARGTTSRGISTGHDSEKDGEHRKNEIETIKDAILKRGFQCV